MTLRRAILWVGLVAVLVYGNALPNGFAYDDTAILAQNSIVTEGRALDAWRSAYWPGHSEGSGLYRPLTVSSFALEWQAYGPDPLGFHAVNVLVHAGISVLVLLLLVGWTTVSAGFVGALVFAVHPLHTEAVANVVGRSELYAALLVLLAVLWYRDRVPTHETPLRARIARTVGIGVAYFLALSSKEIAVTLPALLVLVEWARRSEHPWWRRVLREAPVYLACLGALAAYLASRYVVLGTLLGELPAPELRHLDTAQRIMTAVSLWPEYLRLLVLPIQLSADYSPAVLFAARTFDLTVALGAALLASLGVLVWRTWSGPNTIAWGILWFAIVILPVSQFLFPTGVLLAERTLYLPSVGIALVAAGVWMWAGKRLATSGKEATRPLRAPAIVAAIAILALGARTWERNPTWMSSFTVFQSLAADHPESSLALRSRGAGLVRAGDLDQGRRAYEAAVELAPDNYSLLTEVGHFYNEQQAWDDAERTLIEAIRVAPNRPGAYRLLAQQYLLRERFREGHAVAVRGLEQAGADAELFALMSESYVARPDLGAAIRARHAALAQAPYSVSNLERLAQLFEMAGDTSAATQARERARAAAGKEPQRPRFTPTGRVLSEGDS